MATLYPFDISSVLHAGAAITATGVGSVAFYDVGAEARFPSVAVCAITALDKTDCLLYTSPSPRDRQKSRMPSSA